MVSLIIFENDSVHLSCLGNWNFCLQVGKKRLEEERKQLAERQAGEAEKRRRDEERIVVGKKMAEEEKKRSEEKEKFAEMERIVLKSQLSEAQAQLEQSKTQAQLEKLQIQAQLDKAQLELERYVLE